MTSIGQNRVFDKSALEECCQGGTTVLEEAERISQEMQALAKQVASLCARVPSEAKETGLESLAQTVGQSIGAADYQIPKEKLNKRINKLTDETYSADTMAGEAQKEAKSAVEKAIGMLGELSSLIDTGIINLPYAEFTQSLKECREGMEEEAPGIEEKLKQAADTMCGLQKYSALYSRDPVNLTTGNLYYEKKVLPIEGDVPYIFHLYYNAINRRKGPLHRNWCHSYRIKLRKEEELVLDWEDGARYHFFCGEDGNYRNDRHPGMRLKEEKEGYSLWWKEKEKRKKYFFDKGGKLKEIREKESLLKICWKEEEIQSVTDQYGKGYFLTYGEDGILQTVRDHSGREITFSYEGNRLTGVENPEGKKEVYSYLENGKIGSIIDERGVTVVRNEYDKYRRIIKQDYPDGGRQTYRYLDKEKKVVFTETDGSESSYIHDYQLRHRRTQKENGSETYSYTEKGQLKRYTDMLGNRTEYGYRPDGQSAYKKNPDGSSIRYYYDEKGRRIGVQHPDGKITEYTYKGHQLTGIREPGGRELLAEYNDKDQLICVKYPGGKTKEATYDGQGQMTELRLPDGTKYHYRYDSLNRLTEAEDEKGGLTQITYDTGNRITRIKLPDGETRSYTYDACGFLIKAVGKEGEGAIFERDAMESVTAVTDPCSNRTVFERDAMQRITAVQLPDKTRLTYEYRKGEKMPAVMPDKSRLTYDAAGRLAEIARPGMRNLQLCYDANSRLTEIKSGETALLTLMYDPCGRVKQAQRLGEVIEYEYDNSGKRSLKKENGTETAYGYNLEGDLLWEKETRKNGITRKRYRRPEKTGSDENHIQYRADGRIGNITDKAGSSISCTYTEIGFLKEIERNGEIWQTLERDCRGHIRKQTDALGNACCYTYDLEGRLESCTDEEGNTSRYYYDSLGRIKEAIHSGCQPICYIYGEDGSLLKIRQGREEIQKPIHEEREKGQ